MSRHVSSVTSKRTRACEYRSLRRIEEVSVVEVIDRVIDRDAFPASIWPDMLAVDLWP